MPILMTAPGATMIKAKTPRQVGSSNRATVTQITMPRRKSAPFVRVVPTLSRAKERDSDSGAWVSASIGAGDKVIEQVRKIARDSAAIKTTQKRLIRLVRLAAGLKHLEERICDSFGITGRGYLPGAGL